ncbi:MAG: hypothetical protein BGN86_13495 [Caulobacterales bacterium 68-7]|nr:MAG: hypothetical protein BGN86_13495 [Caulobacterales bacterium 68-7]
MRRLKQFARASDGGTAAEFALVLPIMILLTFGGMGASWMMYANTSVHYATEDAARCFAVNTTVCTNAAAVQTYGVGKYRGPTLASLTFTASTQACGRQVVGTGTYTLRTGLRTISVPISATSCYPA